MASTKINPPEVLTDEEMEALEAGSSDDVLTDEQMAELEGSEAGKKSITEQLLSGINPMNLPKNLMAGLEMYDKATGAPVRKLVTEMATGETLDKAPSGAEQVERMFPSTKATYKEMIGLPEWFGGGISPSDIYGLPLEMVQDPLLLGGAAIKGIGKAASSTNNMVKSLLQGISPLEKELKAISEVAPQGKALSPESSIVNKINQEKMLSFGQDVKAPSTSKEFQSWKPSAEFSDSLPQKKRLQEIIQIAPDIKTKPMSYHFQMLENPKSMKETKLIFENLPTTEAKKIAAYNQQMVNESSKKISDISSEISPTKFERISDAGDYLSDKIKFKHEAVKTELAPLFNELKNSPITISRQDNALLLSKIADQTKIGKVLELDEQSGRFMLARNSPKTGLSDKEHSLISRVVDDMNDGLTFKEVQDTREFLRKSIDPANPSETVELSKIRSILLDELEVAGSNMGPGVKEVFKRYAQNERALENLEKIIGGQVETFDAIYRANPEKIIDKVFSNQNNVKIATDYLGKETIDEMIAAYVDNGIRKATDSAKGFDPSKFRNWLKSNSSLLQKNLSPEIAARLSAYSDYGWFAKRFMDEVNPSGTAASLIANRNGLSGLAEKVGNQGIMSTIASETIGAGAKKIKQREALAKFNKMFTDELPLPVKRSSIPSVGIGKLATPGAVSSVGRVGQKEKDDSNYEFFGYPSRMIIKVSPDEVEILRQELDSNSGLNLIERSKRINLLNKGLHYIGE